MYGLQRNNLDRRKNRQPAQNVSQEPVQFTERERLQLKKTTVRQKEHTFQVGTRQKAMAQPRKPGQKPLVLLLTLMILVFFS